VIPYKEALEQTVFQLACDMLKDICQVVHAALSYDCIMISC